MPEYISSAGVLCICMYFWLDLNWTGEALGWVGTIGGEWWGELCVGEEERGGEGGLDRRRRGCGCGIMGRCLQQPFMQYLPIRIQNIRNSLMTMMVLFGVGEEKSEYCERCDV